jgi:nicotinamidase-related amidase
MDIPVLWTEQIPEKMGPTMEPFDGLLRVRAAPLAKTTFSCWGEPAFREAVAASGRYQFVLCGIETHVCVYQTAMDLLLAGFEVAVAADAVSSRTATNKAFALECMRDAGAAILTTEMMLFEWVRDSKEPFFRDVLKLVK